ncbi:MAG: hypothetical protein LW875_06250 [Proteobacteria bacterium]|nr:hypothetical protein [Pseudomonadota bacterium]
MRITIGAHSKFIRTILAFSALILSTWSQAQAQAFGPTCQMARGLKFNFFMSPENSLSGAFGPQADRLPPTVISNCKGAGGKVLGLGLGLRIPSLTSDASDVSFDGSFRPDSCKISNSPFKTVMSFDERKDSFERQFKLLRSCTFLELTHLDNKPIHFSDHQKFCKMQKLPNGKVIAEGDFCYVRIQPDMRLVVGVGIKPDCLNSAYLEKKKIQPNDIEALLQAFVVDDETSLVTENMIGSSKVRLSLMPSSQQVSVTKDFGPEQPAFPDTFATDIHMGPIRILDGSFGDDKKTFFDLSLLVDSRATRNCRNSLCVGPGDYQQPIAGEVELAEISSSGRQVLDSWYSGNPSEPFLKSSWQGIFKFGRKTSEGLELKQGKTYELQIQFFNPFDDYMMLIKGYEQILVDLTLMNGTAGLDVINPLNSLRNLVGLPQVPQLPSLGKVEIEQELEKVRQVIAQLGSNLIFPPFYNNICSLDTKNCQRANSTAKYLTLKTRFTIQGTNDGDQSLNLVNITTVKESPVQGSYRKNLTALPGLVCE